MTAPTIYGWGGLHPGSDESAAQGCTCARMDNNRGLYEAPGHPGSYARAVSVEPTGGEP